MSETKNKPDYMLTGVGGWGGQLFILEQFINVMVISLQNVSAVLRISAAGWKQALEPCNMASSSSTVEADEKPGLFF